MSEQTAESNLQLIVPSSANIALPPDPLQLLAAYLTFEPIVKYLI